MSDDRPTIEAKFGDVVQRTDPRVLERYLALKLPGVDRRFVVPPTYDKPEQNIGLDNV